MRKEGKSGWADVASRRIDPWATRRQRSRESGWNSEERSTERTSMSVVLGMFCARHRAYWERMF